MDLCRYRNLFGKPREQTGFRKYRLGGIALFDVLVTLLCTYLLSYLFKLPFLPTTAAAFLLGIVVHRLFCVRTAVDVMLFPNMQ